MNLNYLEFEQPVAELEAKIEELRLVGADSKVNISAEIGHLETKARNLLQEIFANISPWQIVQLARHPLRPQTRDYLPLIFDEFIELHGDRQFGDDPAIITGIANLDMGNLSKKPVMIIGQQKGRDTKEKVHCNFGMPHPEGYRKALRFMNLAERFKLPIISFIDTPGAYPGIEAEARGQAQAIAQNLFRMSELKVPIICLVIGEGASGGALGIGVGDEIWMLEYSYYSVISPEGCAAILWKTAEKAQEAAQALGITAPQLVNNGLIDGIIQEPLGGAHRNLALAAKAIKNTLSSRLFKLQQLPTHELLEQRYQKLMDWGLKE